MGWGWLFRSVVVLLLPAVGIANADPTIENLLTCSAEYYARAEYVNSLRQVEPAHYKFLMGRSDMFLRAAEARSPIELTGCNDSSGLTLGLVLCQGPASLWDERKALMLDRLIEIVEEHKGVYRLPVCMEDAACSDCLKLLDDLVQSQPSNP
jgi:hypothetical protein